MLKLIPKTKRSIGSDFQRGASWSSVMKQIRIEYGERLMKDQDVQRSTISTTLKVRPRIIGSIPSLILRLHFRDLRIAET